LHESFDDFDGLELRPSEAKSDEGAEEAEEQARKAMPLIDAQLCARSVSSHVGSQL